MRVTSEQYDKYEKKIKMYDVAINMAFLYL